MSRFTVLTFLSLMLSALLFFWKKQPLTIPFGEGLVVKKEWLRINSNPVTDAQDIRPADQTFLTFPEWFLVFSPGEQAKYYKRQTSTTFPFMSHVAQLWTSYRVINNQIKEDFPVNTGYHFMIWVIATSTTVEYGVKSLYENLIGRLTDTQAVVTEEDKFNAEFANEYVMFIKDISWYKFDFKSQLKKLWSLPMTGDFMFRKWERRFVLTSELLIKWGYGKLIGMGTQTVYEEAIPTTVVLVNKVPENFTKEEILQSFDDLSALIKLPRYDRFKEAAIQLANEGVAFKEVAGNDGAILLSILLPREKTLDHPEAQVIFIQPLTSNPSNKRIVLVTTVPQFHVLLRQLSQDNINVEHVFDF